MHTTFRCSTLASPIVAIRQDETGVEITVEDRSGRHQVRGDYLISTVPFPVLRDIAVTPAFSAVRRKAIREVPMTSITRVYLQCRERFWEKAGNDSGLPRCRDRVLGTGEFR